MKNLPGFGATAAVVIILGVILLGGGAYVAMNPEVLKTSVTGEVAKSATIDEASLTATSVSTTITGTATGVDAVVFGFADTNEGFWRSPATPVIDGRWSVTSKFDAGDFKDMSMFYVTVRNAETASDPYDKALVVEQVKIAPKESSVKARVEVTTKWKIDDLGVEDGFIPKKRVSIIANGASHEIGVFTGGCNEVNDTLYMLSLFKSDGVISMVNCYYAGGGDQIALVNVNGNLVVQKRWTNEPVPMPEGEELDLEGDFETVLDLKLKAD